MLVAGVARRADGRGARGPGKRPRARPRTSGSAACRTAPYGVLQAAGLLFFAFAGYARIATLGEEVRDPARTIPRAIPLALGITVVDLPRGGRDRARRRWAPTRWPPATAPLATAVDAVGRRLGAAGRACRGRGREPGRAARPDRRRRPHRARDGPRGRPAARRSPRSTPATRCHAPRELAVAAIVVLLVADHRPARRDRLQLVRRPRSTTRSPTRRRSRSAARIGAGRGSSTSAGALGCAVLVVSLPSGARRLRCSRAGVLVVGVLGRLLGTSIAEQQRPWPIPSVQHESALPRARDLGRRLLHRRRAGSPTAAAACRCSSWSARRRSGSCSRRATSSSSRRTTTRRTSS